jgi:amino acid transporter
LGVSLTSDWREWAFRKVISTGNIGGFLGFSECCCRAIFGHIGLQSLGIIAAEAENPKKNIPKAARKVAKRIIIVAAALTLSLNISANDPILVRIFQDPTINPEGAVVFMVRRWGLTGLAHVVNGVTLIAAFGI